MKCRTCNGLVLVNGWSDLPTCANCGREVYRRTAVVIPAQVPVNRMTYLERMKLGVASKLSEEGWGDHLIDGAVESVFHPVDAPQPTLTSDGRKTSGARGYFQGRPGARRDIG